MEELYSVSFKVHNKENDGWAAKVQYTTNNERDAKANFGSECSRLFGTSDFDFVLVMLIDTYGNVMTKDFIDERVAPQPVPPVDEEGE